MKKPEYIVRLDEPSTGRVGFLPLKGFRFGSPATDPRETEAAPRWIMETANAIVSPEFPGIHAEIVDRDEEIARYLKEHPGHAPQA